MTIVRLTTNEAIRLRAIRLRSLEDAPDAFGSTFQEMESRPIENWTQQLKDMVTFVAVRDDDDVGIVRGVADNDQPDTAWLNSMWVAPDDRGMGLGDQLILALVAWAKERRFRRIVLDVGDENRNAIALYERMGFLPNGVTSQLPSPRQHIQEHQREFLLRSDNSLL